MRKTIAFVTHFIAEAIFLADRVVVISARPGRIAAIYDVDIPHPRPVEIQHRPDFIARGWRSRPASTAAAGRQPAALRRDLEGHRRGQDARRQDSRFQPRAEDRGERSRRQYRRQPQGDRDVGRRRYHRRDGGAAALLRSAAIYHAEAEPDRHGTDTVRWASPRGTLVVLRDYPYWVAKNSAISATFRP